MSRLLFICPDNNKPAGGVKQIYRQVDVLNAHGYDAQIVHGIKNFKVNWFENSTKVLWNPEVAALASYSPKSLKKRLKESLKKTVEPQSNSKTKKLVVNDDDIFVFPEFYGKDLNKSFTRNKAVVYNQNCYYSFRGYGINFSKQFTSIYNQDRLLGVIVASEDAQLYLKSCINKPVYRVKYGMDAAVFSYCKTKKQQIAFMPRKLREDSEQILNILNLKGKLNGWNVVSISGMNEAEVAQVLKDSAVFLSFNHREGFGMPPAEAMSCGCIVVGYSGQGGNEYLLPEISYKVPQRNIKAFVNILEEVLCEFNSNPEKMRWIGEQASSYIQDNYSMGIEEQSILKVWNAILTGK